MTHTPSSIDAGGLPASRLRRAACYAGITLWSFKQHRPAEPFWKNDAEAQDTSGLPSIGLVTPTYQSGAFLNNAIESVISQGYPSLRYVVCDGGSSDETLSILKSHQDNLTQWVSAPDKGQGDAINRGFDLIDQEGDPPEIMGWLNADDRHLPWTLHTVGRFFRDNPDVDAVYGHRIISDAQGMVVGRWLLPKHRAAAMLWRDYVPQETLFWRRSLWERIADEAGAHGGGIDASLGFAIDWDMLVRFHQADAVFARLPMFLGIFTAHDQQKSVRTKHSVGKQEFAMIRKRAQRPSRTGIMGFLKRAILRTGSALYILESMAWEWAWRLGARKHFGLRK